MAVTFQLSADDRDQLCELVNIGVSHASTTLSQLLKHRVAISVPTVDVKSAESALQFLENSNELTVAVLLKITGGIDGYVFLIFPHDAVAHLVHSLSGKNIDDLRTLDDFDRSTIQEVGNVLTGGMLNGLSRFLHIKLIHSVPDVVVDMGVAMFNSLSASMMLSSDEFLSLDVAICVDAAPQSIACAGGEMATGRMFLFLGPEAAEHILSLTRAMVA